MRQFIILCVVWAILALSTLYFVIQNSSSLLAAFAAWLGGIITHALYVRGRRLYLNSRV